MSVESLSINQSGRQKSGRRAQQNGCDNNKPRPAQGSIFEAKDRRARVMPDKKHQHQQDRAEQSGPQPQGQPTGEGRAAKLGAWRAKNASKFASWASSSANCNKLIRVCAIPTHSSTNSTATPKVTSQRAPMS